MGNDEAEEECGERVRKVSGKPGNAGTWKSEKRVCANMPGKTKASGLVRVIGRPSNSPPPKSAQGLLYVESATA